VRKFFVALLVTAALGSGAAACGGGGGGGSGQQPTGTTSATVPTNNPIERSRGVVDQLNEQQRQLEDQTGG
jgi:hypothetical protein